MLTTEHLDARRLGIAIAALLIAALLFGASAHGAPAVQTRTFKPIGSDARSLSFRLVGVTPASVRRARLIAGRRGVAVPLAAVRRGARGGVLRLPRWLLTGERAGRRAKPAPRRARLVLTVAVPRRDGSARSAPGSGPEGGALTGRIGGDSSAQPPSSHIDGTMSGPHDAGASALAGMKLHVETDSFARRQADAWRSSRPLDAADMDRIAIQPQATWLGGWSGDVRSAVDKRVSAAAADGAVPTLVAYNIPQRDCGSHSAGGAASAADYRTWIRELATGVGERRAIVILEPDALAGLDCLSRDDQRTRLTVLRDAVSVLASLGSVVTYIDAGHSAWRPADVIAARLTSVGIAGAQGFSLNVSNFRSTAEELAYGRAIAGLTGGKRFVVDTSRNGPATASTEWCNPIGRALGSPPTTDPGQVLVDAYLWIKRPGESDGTCNGGPPAGAWWPEYALQLARRAG